MSPATRLRKVLLSLQDTGLRLGWLRSYLSCTPTPEAAQCLDALCDEGEQSVQGAREALLSVAMLLVELGDCELVARLRAEAAERHLLSLGRLLRRGPDSPERESPPEELPVPDYGTGRELTVGERRSLARRPHRRCFERLLADPHPLVIRQLLKNPRLTEDDIVYLATRRPARIVAIREIVAAPRWLNQPRVRMSILLNPGSPSSVAMPLLVLCTRPELSEIVHATDASLALRATARELLERRPPLPPADPADSPLQ